MKKNVLSNILLLIIVIGNSGLSIAENNLNDPVLIRIADQEISLSEFEEIYRKSNVDSHVAEPKSVKDYLEMYIDFRLKVSAAMEAGLHTNPGFVSELAGYRKQLAQQYLVDHEVTDRLLDEAYERSQYDVWVSHILLQLNEHAAPADTLAVFNRMMELRDRALAGEPFSELAIQYSDDPSAKGREATQQQPARRGNAGNLGFFSVFNMVYPFETAAYNTPVGEISMPIRSSFGYHILKVHDRLPAMGQAQVAHIMLMTPLGMEESEVEEKKQKIGRIHQQINDGADFSEMVATYSEDRQSVPREGKMPPFASNRIVPQFVKAIHELEEGEISEPVRSDFGWHIIKLIERTPPPSYEEAYGDLRNRIQRDIRSQLGQEVVIERLKREYQLEMDHRALEDFYNVVDESIFSAQWDQGKAAHLQDELFRFASEYYSQQDFAEYLANTQARQTAMEVEHYIYMVFDRFVNQEILAYEDARLEEKYPEFRMIMQEYHDGILLFEITDQKVWSKATSDQEALLKFYEMYAEELNWDDFDGNRGAVIAEYQNHLEKKWVAELREQFEVYVDRSLLQKMNTQ